MNERNKIQLCCKSYSKSIQSLCRLLKQYTLPFGYAGGIFRDDLWCVTEMHLVNSEAVIRLDTHKHSIGAPEE